MAKNKTANSKAVAAFERSAGHLLRRALQLSLDYFAEEAGPEGLTQRQYAVLAAVASREGAAQTELVRLTGIDRSTLAELAARMISKGLLERERSQTDGRANAVSLTDAGREALEAARPRATAADVRLMKLLSKGSRREALLDLLSSVVEAGEAAATGEPAAKPKKDKAGKQAKKKRKKAAREGSDADIEQGSGA